MITNNAMVNLFSLLKLEEYIKPKKQITTYLSKGTFIENPDGNFILPDSSLYEVKKVKRLYLDRMRFSIPPNKEELINVIFDMLDIAKAKCEGSQYQLTFLQPNGNLITQESTGELEIRLVGYIY